MPKAAFIVLSLLLSLAGFAVREAAAFPVAGVPAVHMQDTPSSIVKAGSRHHHAGGKHHHDRYYKYRYKHRRYYGWNDRYRPYYGWRRPYYGYPCGDWNFDCGPYYGYSYYDDYWWPGFDSGIVLTYRPYRHASRHVAWCKDRYRSYNPRNNTWVSYSGKIRQCVSPYSR